MMTWAKSILMSGAALAVAALPAHAAADKAAILATYADVAHAMYGDALSTAKELQAAVDALIASPGEETMNAARAAWLAARVPYQQTEGYRFGNAVVDDWEGKVNAWPLDEGLIDYVAESYGTSSEDNPLYTANIVANAQISFGGETVDASTIDKELIQSLQEAGQIEANVATGYHAIEFLLWGQDLHGTEAGKGERPWTDYATGDACTNGNCDRRAQYLKAATDLMVDDLAWMTAQWAEGGEARAGLVNGDPDAGLSTILTGLGSLSYGELAGERMKLGLLLHDPEEEHDCFSDNTHNSHYYDIVGMQAIYLGSYTRVDGSKVEGTGITALVAEADPALDAEMRAKLDATVAAAAAMKQRAESTEAYDQMIGEGNDEGNAVVQAVIDALTDQTRTIEKQVAALGLQPITIEGSDSLDDPAKVFE